MRKFECIITSFDFEQPRSGLETLAIEHAAATHIDGPAKPPVLPTSAADKQQRADQLREDTIRLRDIYVLRGKFPSEYTGRDLAIEVKPDSLELVQGCSDAAAYHSFTDNKGTIGDGPQPVASGMAKEEAKRKCIRAAKNYFFVCSQARRELDAAVGEVVEEAVENKETEYRGH